MKSKSGFTIVEVLTVIVVLGILISIVFIAFGKVQRDSRDSTRRGNVSTIAEALEKYFSKNGEYPSVRSLVNNYPDNPGSSVATKLGIDATSLKMPKMPSGATNALYSATNPTNDYIVYIGTKPSDNTNCQTTVAGGCDEYTLKYVEEGSGSTIVLESRHKGRAL